MLTPIRVGWQFWFSLCHKSVTKIQVNEKASILLDTRHKKAIFSCENITSFNF